MSGNIDGSNLPKVLSAVPSHCSECLLGLFEMRPFQGDFSFSIKKKPHVANQASTVTVPTAGNLADDRFVCPSGRTQLGNG